MGFKFELHMHLFYLCRNSKHCNWWCHIQGGPKK